VPQDQFHCGTLWERPERTNAGPLLDGEAALVPRYHFGRLGTRKGAKESLVQTQPAFTFDPFQTAHRHPATVCRDNLRDTAA
jgi:hypothetical protein